MIGFIGGRHRPHSPKKLSISTMPFKRDRRIVGFDCKFGAAVEAGNAQINARAFSSVGETGGA